MAAVESKVEILGQAPSAAQKRRARKEASGLAAEARRSLRRHGLRVSHEAREEIAAAIAAVDAAVESRDHDQICDRMVVLGDLCERHAFVKKSTFREYTDSIFVAVLVALLIRAFVVEAFKIPSGSMIPTMEVGDHIFVNKFIYGLHVPFTKIKFLEYRKPKRGEVIVFIYPLDPDKDFIKRIIAVEGDSVEVRHDVVYVNGKPIEHRRLPGEWTYWDYDEHTDKWSQRTCVRDEEKLDGHTYVTLHDAHPVEDYGSYRGDFPDAGRPFVVPKDSVFVLGDNRNNSHDSRYWGSVPLENIRGEALVVWWSSGGPDGIRWDRLGHLVE